MKSRPKDLGTKWETNLTLAARSVGLKARRLAEGSAYDEGDVEIVDPLGRRWIIECRDRMNMNIHAALGKAQVKAARADCDQAGVAWRRMVRPVGPDGPAKRRRQAGPPIVAIPVSTFLVLLANQAPEVS